MNESGHKHVQIPPGKLRARSVAGIRLLAAEQGKKNGRFPNKYLLITSLIFSVFIHGFLGFFDYFWMYQNGMNRWLVRD